MKRSEMVEVLRKSTIYHMNCVDCCTSDEELFSKVLGSLEDVGMTPPFLEMVDWEMGHGWEAE